MAYKDKQKQASYQARWLRLRRDKWIKENGPCKDCGTHSDLQVHHTDPDQKEEHRIWSWTMARREAELAKCIVLCRKCHGRRHRPIPEHGTNSRYTSKDLSIRCRCDLCKDAHRKVAAAYRGRPSV